MLSEQPFTKLAAVLAIGCWGAAAGPVALRPITSLVERANVIAIGNIVSDVRASGRATIVLKVERTLKGDVPPSGIATATLAGATGLHSAFPEAVRVLVFLRNGAGGSFDIEPALSGAESISEAVIAVPKNTKLTGPRPPATTPLDKALEAVADAVDTDTRSAPGLGAPVSLVFEARKTKSPILRQAFVRYRNNPDRRIRHLGIEGLIALNEVSGLLAAESEPEALKNRSILESIQSYYVADNAASVSVLSRMAASPDAQVKLAAAAALARVHTPATLHILGTLLDSDVPQMQAAAVGGLAMFANNVPVGRHEPASGDWKYRTDETIRYSAMDERMLQNNPAILAFWKSWWARHRAELETLAKSTAAFEPEKSTGGRERGRM